MSTSKADYTNLDISKKVYMIRHGYSESNQEMVRLIEKHGQKLNVGHFCDTFYKKDMIDCSLTP
jgi:hypothetical protein